MFIAQARPDAMRQSLALARSCLLWQVAPHLTLIYGLRWDRWVVNDNQLTVLANLAVGDQENETANLHLNNDPLGASVQRPPFVGRDTLRTTNIYQVDMRYTRILRRIHEHIMPKILVEANNVFNNRNVTTLNTKATVNAQGIITAQPSLAPTSTVLEGRLIQMGIRVDW